MKEVDLAIPGVKLFTPTVFEDDRGFFFESFRSSWLPGIKFVQDNHSQSTRGTLRGLHYQLNHPQGKLVRVIQGTVYDVAVDLRASSPNFGQWCGSILSAENREIFWVPPGFAHGFLVLSETAEFVYKCSDYYAPGDEYSIRWDDETLAIEWPAEALPPLLSDKDSNAPALADSPTYP